MFIGIDHECVITENFFISYKMLQLSSTFVSLLVKSDHHHYVAVANLGETLKWNLENGCKPSCLDSLKMAIAENILHPSVLSLNQIKIKNWSNSSDTQFPFHTITDRLHSIQFCKRIYS